MAGWIRIIFGSLLFLVSFGLVIGGGAIFVVVPFVTDDNGYINSPSEIIEETGGQAIVFFSDSWEIETDSADSFGSNWVFDTSNIFKLKVSIENLASANEYRIYYGEADASRIFLSNISYYEISDIDFKFKEGELNLDKTVVASTYTGDTAVPDWYAETSGPVLEITEFYPGEFAIILLSPDAGTDLNCSLQVGISIPILNVVAGILLVFGGLFMMVSIFLIVWGASAKPKPRDMPLDRVRYYKAQESVVKESAGKKHLICAVCGTESPGDSKFCFECGEPLYSVQEPEIGVRKAVGSTTDMVVADGWPRFWAWLIDIVVIGFVVESLRWPFFLISPNSFDFFLFGASFSLTTVGYFIYWTLMEYYYGQSIGKMVLGLEVVTETGEKLRMIDTAISAAGKAFFLPFDIIISWFIDDEGKKRVYGADLNQRVSQMLSKTVVIRKRHSFPEEGEKSSFLSPKY